MISAPTTFNGNAGHWMIHSTHRPAQATAVAFIPPLDAPFYNGLGTLTLPMWSFDTVGVDGQVLGALAPRTKW